jgi:hypothetical protein
MMDRLVTLEFPEGRPRALVMPSEPVYKEDLVSK